MKKHSKALRVFCIIVPVLLVVVLLLTALSPLWKREDRVSASAAASTKSFLFTFNSGAIVGTLMSSAALSYTKPSGSSASHVGSVNMTNGFLNFYNISFDDTKVVKLSIGFLPGISIHSVAFGDNNYGGSSVTFSGSVITISDLDSWDGTTNSIPVSVVCSGGPVSYWQTGGIFIDSADVNVQQYISSARLQYSDSAEAQIPSYLNFVDDGSDSLKVSPGTIYLNMPTFIHIRTAYGVSLSSVSVVVGTGGINGNNSGGIAASLSSVSGEGRYYEISLTINPSNINLMNLYLVPSFTGSPDTDGAYDDGYDDGYSDGYDVGYSNGVQAGTQQSYDQGYNAGYQAGYTDGSGTSYSSLNVVSLFLSPVNSFLATPLFGSFSLGTAFSVVLVVLLGAIFIKMFAGG